MSVWLPYWSMQAALDSALSNAGVIGTASPFWYVLAGDSRIEDEPGAGDPSVVSALRARGIRVVPMVTETAGIGAFARILASRGQRAVLVHALASLASHRGYGGLDLDFQTMATDPRHDPGPADRIAVLYPKLIAQVCAALHAIQRVCQVTVMPRTTSAPVYWHGDLATWVYDYAALAKAADRVQVMAYDEHTPATAAGPVAPLPWVRRVLAFARSQMPLGRVSLGVAAYGYDWSARGHGTTVTARQAPGLAAQAGARVHWSATQAEATFTYGSGGRRSVVWYEDATADYDRALLAANEGVGGIAIWAAGYEDPSLWPMLRRLRNQ